MSRHDDLGVVPPVACYPDLLAIVTESVPGQTLLQYLEARISWFPGARDIGEACASMTGVGRWIREYQQSTPVDATTSVRELRDYIDIRLERLVRYSAARFTTSDRDSVLRYIERVGATLPAGALRLVQAHCDMSLGNILVSPQRVVVLDFAMAQPATWLYDVTKVYFQVGLMAAKPQFRSGPVRLLQAALLRGFDSSLDAGHSLFRLVMLQHRINHLSALYVSPGAGITALYNGALRRQHHRWLADELQRGELVDGRR
jgi:hypothetical protein